MLKIHEHIIEVTNPVDDLSQALTSGVIWQMLEYYVRHPDEYLEVIKSARVAEVQEAEQVALVREIDYGSMKVNDIVRFEGIKSVVTEVSATEEFVSSRFTIRLESPVEGTHFLRFTYEEARDEMPPEDIFLQLRRQAYEQKDRELVDCIRARAADKINPN